MNGEVNRAYAYYKAQHPGSILLFRVKNLYEAYFDDADRIRELLGSSTLKFTQREQTVCLPSDSICDYVSVLGDSGCALQFIEYRNDDGEFAIPDVNLLENEKAMDF